MNHLVDKMEENSEKCPLQFPTDAFNLLQRKTLEKQQIFTFKKWVFL